MQVFLIGFMASGKTTIGRSLARLLGVRFIDLDGEIEARAGSTVREIFERRGEAAFRRLEREQLRVVAIGTPASVVATGGGTATVPANRALIRETGTSVWLDPPLPTILERLVEKGSDRPLFRDAEQVSSLYRERLAVYERSDIRIGIGAGEGPDEVAARIARRLEERVCVS